MERILRIKCSGWKLHVFVPFRGALVVHLKTTKQRVM